MSLLLILDDSPVVGVKETVAVSDEVSVSVTPTERDDRGAVGRRVGLEVVARCAR